ncbi:glycosyltransferase family 2 protein [Hydrogenophaga flava]|uniref:glycosyltransferase family 2 protein n=1 Tax=Hydrogenophaga flava TaxID=65657 RepID=UPI000824AF72|nr:glycosyltransferase family 2 protein [Hydrogenophaga flava]
MDTSFIIPAHNEEATLATLVEQICEAVRQEPEMHSFDIFLVDDGSTDRTWSVIDELALRHHGVVRGIRLRRNFGKAAALSAGFRESRGKLVFTMDADLQDDPKEIPRFVARIKEGFDLVSGWKRVRHDPRTKTLPSRFFNRVTSTITGIRLHDFNCGFKCYRREVIDHIVLYGELHRFIPVLAHDLGFRVTELAVEHHPRTHGRSHYGWERYARGALDLITVVAITRWLNKPGHLFGGLGILLGLLGFGVLLYLSILWLLGLGPIGSRPLLMFGVLVSVMSVQLVSLGVIAEFFIKLNQPRDHAIFVAERTVPPLPAKSPDATP